VFNENGGFDRSPIIAKTDAALAVDAIKREWNYRADK
jgi:hypothetical protein